MSHGSSMLTIAVLATKTHYSPGASLVILGLGVVFGILGYTRSEAFKKRTGITPWRWPSFVWAIVGFISLLLWAILFLIATRTTNRTHHL